MRGRDQREWKFNSRIIMYGNMINESRVGKASDKTKVPPIALLKAMYNTCAYDDS